MMKHVIVEIFVKIESSRNISMLVSIPNPPQEKDGDYLLEKKFTEVILSCNILVKSSQLIVKKAGLGLNSIAIQHAHI